MRTICSKILLKLQKCRMRKIMTMMYYHFYDSYDDYLSNHDMINDRVNIEIIEYVSDGTSYSELHAKNYYIDGPQTNIHCAKK